ncbi:hypothetical protein HOLleu_02205 [Holothuria leucospilota]|uniref:Uncharacterized protein n=1 Tax=Holothuria leucospilota TaxID=206669 RepID=A0A9Q1CRV9_HOLLE|nr:hypothetical protein HOLleu_02205 [Holothuria leucospilota]
MATDLYQQFESDKEQIVLNEQLPAQVIYLFCTKGSLTILRDVPNAPKMSLRILYILLIIFILVLSLHMIFLT